MYSYGKPGQVIGKRLRILTSADDQGHTATDDLNASWSYDNEGRLTGVTYPVDANYISQFGPAPAYTYTYNGLGQLNGMTDNNNNGASVVNGVTYNPAGQLTQMISSSGTETRSYNNMGQLTNITVPGAINLTYTYSTSGQNNGKILSQTDAITGETVTHAYDSLNRLICSYGGNSSVQAANCPTNPAGAVWGQGFQYDGFGNLTAKNVLAGAVPTLSVGIDPNTNHIIGQSYDANGNMLSSPTGSPLGYDAENRLTSTVQYGNPNSMEYAYDGQNKRVWSCAFDTNAWQSSVDQYNVTSQKFYFYGPDGRLLSTFTPKYMAAYRNYTQTFPPTLTMSAPATRLYFGSRLLGNEDRLGSHDRYYPYGEDRGSNPGDGSVTFATYTRDSATGLNYADQRYYASGWGRFNSPDPYVAIAATAEPQSWNRYSYVQNDPVNYGDRRGLYRTAQECIEDPDSCLAEDEPTMIFISLGDDSNERSLPNQRVYDDGSRVPIFQVDSSGTILLGTINWDAIFNYAATTAIPLPVPAGGTWTLDGLLQWLAKLPNPWLVALAFSFGNAGTHDILPPNKSRCPDKDHFWEPQKPPHDG